MNGERVILARDGNKEEYIGFLKVIWRNKGLPSYKKER